MRIFQEFPMSSFRSVVKLLSAVLLGSLLVVSTVASADADSRREKSRKQSSEVMERFYKAVPTGRTVIANAAGYATFRKLGLKMGVVGGGVGRGLAVAQGGAETFMNYAEGSVGPGLGIKTFDLIFVFETPEALSNFVNKGWEYTAGATAAAKVGDKGSVYEGAHAVSPGVKLYQLTSTGLSADLSIMGTKYFKDKKLN
jgi:lipid-binding SYLF domain-containing protein